MFSLLFLNHISVTIQILYLKFSVKILTLVFTIFRFHERYTRPNINFFLHTSLRLNKKNFYILKIWNVYKQNRLK